MTGERETSFRPLKVKVSGQHIKGESHIDFRTQCAIMTLASGGVIANDALKMRKFIEFQSVLLQPICTRDVSVAIVIDK